MERLRVGVVGVGYLGSRHAEKFAAIDGSALAGVHDIDPERNSGVARQFDLPVCDSLVALIERCDALSICTPTETHAALARVGLERGQHLFIEKPVCATPDESRDLVAFANGRGLTIGVGQIERFNPAVQAISGRIGSPRFIEAHRLNLFSERGLATDVVLELMIHDIDLLLMLAGEEPTEIRAAAVPVMSDTADIANCRLSFPSGCVANLTASRISTSPMRKVRVFAPDHYVSLDLARKSAEVYRLLHRADESLPDGFAALLTARGKRIARFAPPVESYDALEEELRDFVDAARCGRQPRCDLAGGARTLDVAYRVKEACDRHLASVNPGSS